MMVATATLATTESLSPDQETKPRRPTSLAIASSRSRALSANHPVQQAVAATTTTTTTATTTTTVDLSSKMMNGNNNNGPKKISAFTAYSSSSNYIERHYDSNDGSNNNNNSNKAKENNQQHQSNGAVINKIKAAPISASSRGSVNISRHESIRSSAGYSIAMTTGEQNKTNTCFTSLITKANSVHNGNNNNNTGNSNDESLEYASVTYRYLKNMDANGTNKSSLNAVASSKTKYPACARSLMCLTEQQKASTAHPDESIVSVPCPQPSSECPTPAAIRTSLRRRHSDINLSSIANFLRTRFSRHDDTLPPNSQNDADDLLLLASKRLPSKQEQFTNGDGNSSNNNNNNNNRSPLDKQNTSTNGGVNNSHHNKQQSSSSSSSSSCPHACSSGGSCYRRPCFRCKNNLIEAILESDATEV